MKYSAVILLSIAGLVASDWKCTQIGGTCKDYTQNTCIAGYVTGKCSGNNDRRCCKPCSQSCKSKEASDSLRDGACNGKCQHNSNYCDSPYQSGKCGGPSARQCCPGSNFCYDDILKVETTGASAETAKQDKLSYHGVAASRKMAQTDASAMATYKSKILVAAKKYCVQAAVIAGIISRETRAGKVLMSDGFGFDRSGFGLMQVDKGSHNPQGGAFSQTHINQGTKILVDMLKGVRNKHKSWSKLWVYKGGISAYNAGVKNVRTYAGMDVGTTGNDYGNDVVARAKWYKENGY
uniref:lysozyme g-like n=1 Tax=Styela clava TaxID=7725 RepID=UPI00193AAE07|nr:lysozyme g-like [Styela clava]